MTSASKHQEGSTMRGMAQLLSIVLHPLIMPLLTLVVAFRLDPHLSFFLPTPLLLLTYLMVAVMTILFPLTSTLLLMRSGAVSGLSMHGRVERIIPFSLTFFYFGLCYYLLHRTPHHEATFSMFFGAWIALFLTICITMRWKISIHMVGIGGLLGSLFGLIVLHHAIEPMQLTLFILLAGALGTARLLTSDHTMAQIGAGTALGFGCTFVCVTQLWFI